jgi:hypothetical protein
MHVITNITLGGGLQRVSFGPVHSPTQNKSQPITNYLDFADSKKHSEWGFDLFNP